MGKTEYKQKKLEEEEENTYHAVDGATEKNSGKDKEWGVGDVVVLNRIVRKRPN